MECSLKHLSQEGSKVTAHFENGESGVYDILIGGDGVRSRVRTILFPKSPLQSTNLFYFRFVAPNEPSFPHHIWRIFERKEGLFGFIPLAQNRLHCFVQLSTTNPPCLHDEEASYFRHCIAPWHPLLSQAYNARCGPVHAGFAFMVPPGNWSQKYCVLLGDATHALSPTLSQGGSLAMEDALVLALALYSSTSIEKAFLLYQEVREHRCMWAYRMALSQLNSIRKYRKFSLPAPNESNARVSTQLMAAMYRPFLANPLPDNLQQLLAKAHGGQSFPNVFT